MRKLITLSFLAVALLIRSAGLHLASGSENWAPIGRDFYSGAWNSR
jgi:hypothetical protein